MWSRLRYGPHRITVARRQSTDFNQNSLFLRVDLEKGMRPRVTLHPFKLKLQRHKKPAGGHGIPITAKYIIRPTWSQGRLLK